MLSIQQDQHMLSRCTGKKCCLMLSLRQDWQMLSRCTGKKCWMMLLLQQDVTHAQQMQRQEMLAGAVCTKRPAHAEQTHRQEQSPLISGSSDPIPARRHLQLCHPDPPCRTDHTEQRPWHAKPLLTALLHSCPRALAPSGPG